MAAPRRTAEDHVLVARLAAGDDVALGEVYDLLAPVVLGVATRIVVDPTAAEDVCQEVFVQLWCQASSIDLDRCSLRGWASVLAHRRSVDLVRSRERARRREAAGSTTTEIDARMIDLAEHAADAEEAHRARAAVAALPEEQRRAVELAYWGGLSYREVAAELGIPEGTAKSRLRLALGKLAGVLNEKEVTR